VRLAAGLDEQGELDEATVARMLDCLKQFRQRLADFPAARVRAIGTNTFRKARRPQALIHLATGALGYPIEILPSPEEARLIFLGVSHFQAPIEGHRLVVDIGGGSTECILGRGFTPLHLDSLSMGCVTYSLRFFPGGRLTRKAFQRAEIAAQLELETIRERFRRDGWRDAVGSSGTINAVAEILSLTELTDGTVTLAGLKKLRKRMIAAGHVDALELPGLQPDRAPVLAGGLAILKAVFESLGVKVMRTTKAALREGVLYDLIGRIRHEDVRDRTIRSLSERFHVDVEQADRVERTALACLAGAAEGWGLERAGGERLLSWAARMHEIGLALAYSGHHKHGAYILTHSQMPGFPRGEQECLAAVVRGHRRKITRDLFAALSPPWSEQAFRLCLLLRLAVRLNRTRSRRPLPAFELSVDGDTIVIRLPQDWLSKHPLTRADLEDEALVLGGAGIELRVP
jgi:exopolyphosphatase/guanosine-5'-triphosphate,3'-diphosphate pyrophosphatase